MYGLYFKKITIIYFFLFWFEEWRGHATAHEVQKSEDNFVGVVFLPREQP